MQLRIEMLSDTTFGRGEGTAGLVDVEVDYDPKTGLPFIHARTLKGLLVEACSDLLYSLDAMRSVSLEDWRDAALFLFGIPGSTAGTDARLKISHATFSPAFQAAVVQSGMTPEQVLDAWTAVRTQTAATVLGVPEEGSLRSVRVVRRGTVLYAPLRFEPKPDEKALTLLDMVIRTTRRAGLGRNRGRGHIAMRLLDEGDEVDRTAVFASELGVERVS